MAKRCRTSTPKAASRWSTSATSRSPARGDRARLDPDVGARAQADQDGRRKKGDPLQAARLAGIMAAKQTSALIPLCHPLPLSSVHVELTPTSRGYDIEARVRTTAQTGVEMEALTAVAVAALTIYDMVKAVDKAMVIGDIALEYKAGGKSGTYIAKRKSHIAKRKAHSRKTQIAAGLKIRDRACR